VTAVVSRRAASQLVVLAYADEYRAAEVLATLQRLRTGILVEPHDAACVVRGLDWSVKLQYGANLHDDEARTGRAWRNLIAVLLPVPGEGHQSSYASYRLQPEFAAALNDAMPPGSSAVFMHVQRSIVPRLIPELQHFGGTLLETSLDWGAGDRPGGSGASKRAPT
jgi:uncharacterized membrane protein